MEANLALVGMLALIAFGAAGWAHFAVRGQERRVNKSLDRESTAWSDRFDDWTKSFENKFASIEKQISDSEGRLRGEIKEVKEEARAIRDHLNMR